MMHPPTALPRSLAEHLNPPPIDRVVDDSARRDGRQPARSLPGVLAAHLGRRRASGCSRPGLPTGRPGTLDE